MWRRYENHLNDAELEEQKRGQLVAATTQSTPSYCGTLAARQKLIKWPLGTVAVDRGQQMALKSAEESDSAIAGRQLFGACFTNEASADCQRGARRCGIEETWQWPQLAT